VADLKHEQELDEMQQNQPQPEFSQDHIVRRLISKFRKPSDAGTVGLSPATGSSNLLQVPHPQHGIPTVSGQLSSIDSGQSSGWTSAGEGGGARPSDGASAAVAAPSVQRSLAGKQSRWSQLVASAAAGASSAKSAAPVQVGQAGQQQQQQRPPRISSTRSLLDVNQTGADSHAESSSNRSSADGRDDEVDENYFRPGGKGHQALLDNMDKR